MTGHEDNTASRPSYCNGFGPEAPADYAFRVVDEAQTVRAGRRSGRRIAAGPARDLAPGEKVIVEGEGYSVGVFNVDGKFYALKNVCPHAGAPLCQGHIQTTHRPSEVGEFVPDLAGRILRCPWHGWEFDVVTGKGLYDREGRVATYAVEVDENDELIILL